jgi:PAS domain S-box-containing protein
MRATRCWFAEIDSRSDRVAVHAGYEAGVATQAGELSLSSFGELPAAGNRGETVVVQDTSTDPRTAAVFAGTYKPISVRACVVVPMMRDARWVACLSVSSDQPRAWDEREVALVTLIAERVWLWIEHLRLLAELRQRDVDDAIQHTEERFRALVEGVKEYAIFILDPEGNVATWNAGAERLKGYRSEQITGKHFSTFFTVEDRQNDHARFVLGCARRDGRYEEEGWRVRKDGSRFWASVLVTALYGRDGSIDGFAKITRDFTERRNQQEALAAKQVALGQSLKEREVLLQEVHHRVKNNLQVISSLINMQVRKLEHGSTRDALVECQTRVQTIALIHEKLYQSQDYSQVRFADYARSLAANVFHATGISPADVVLELAIDELPLGIDRAIPCGLVINELITNSLKHGLKDGRAGKIRVELKRTDDAKFRLTVQDDGIGLPVGFDIHKAESMGLQLVCTLCEQLDATLVVTSENGAAFQLTFAGSD